MLSSPEYMKSVVGIRLTRKAVLMVVVRVWGEL